MADLRLTNAVDAPEALLQAVRIPRQIVVHHQVGALQVDAFTSSVGGEKHLHIRIVQETRLRLTPVFATHSAVNQNDRLLAAEQRGDLALEIVESVPVLGEDHELLTRRWDGLWDGS